MKSKNKIIKQPDIRKVLKGFEEELIRSGLKDGVIQEYFIAITDFSFYLEFVCNDWSSMSEEDLEIYKELLVRMGAAKISIKRKISRIKRFKEFYEGVKFKKKFL